MTERSCSDILFLVSSLLCLAGPAWSQPAPPPADPSSPPSPAAEAGREPDSAIAKKPDETPAEMECRVLFEEALKRQLSDRPADARDLYQKVIAGCPGSAFAVAARGKLAGMDGGLEPRGEPKARDSSGRVELIIGDSLVWLGYGMLVPFLFKERDLSIQAPLWTGLGAGVAAGVTALLVSRDAAVPEGWTNLHLFSQLWGSWNGMGIFMIAAGSPDFTGEDRWSMRLLSGSVLGGAALGLGASLVFKDAMSLPRGRAEFISSAPLWSSVIATSAVGLAWKGTKDHWRPSIAAILAAGDLGLAAAALWAPPWSRSRVRFVNLIGFGGVLLGDAILASMKQEDPRVYGGVTLGCSLLGLAVGTLVTNGMPDDTAGSDRVPLPALFTWNRRFDLGVPGLRFMPSRDGERDGVGVVVDLFAGRI